MKDINKNLITLFCNFNVEGCRMYNSRGSWAKYDQAELQEDAACVIALVEQMNAEVDPYPTPAELVALCRDHIENRALRSRSKISLHQTPGCILGNIEDAIVEKCWDFCNVDVERRDGYRVFRFFENTDGGQGKTWVLLVADRDVKAARECDRTQGGVVANHTINLGESHWNSSAWRFEVRRHIYCEEYDAVIGYNPIFEVKFDCEGAPCVAESSELGSFLIGETNRIVLDAHAAAVRCNSLGKVAFKHFELSDYVVRQRVASAMLQMAKFFHKDVA